MNHAAEPLDSADKITTALTPTVLSRSTVQRAALNRIGGIERHTYPNASLYPPITAVPFDSSPLVGDTPAQHVHLLTLQTHTRRVARGPVRAGRSRTPHRSPQCQPTRHHPAPALPHVPLLLPSLHNSPGPPATLHMTLSSTVIAPPSSPAFV